MARISETERRIVRRSLGPGWVRIAEREVRNEATALSDSDARIWEEHIDRIREENRRYRETRQAMAATPERDEER